MSGLLLELIGVFQNFEVCRCGRSLCFNMELEVVVLDATKLAEKVANANHFDERNQKNKCSTACSLIILDPHTLKSKERLSAHIAAENDPRVCITLNFRKDDTFVRTSVTFSSKVEKNIKYELSLMFINSQRKFQNVDNLILEKIQENSVFQLAVPIKVYEIQIKKAKNYYRLFHENLIDSHLCLYCEISRQDLIKPLRMERPKTDIFKQIASLYENKQLTDFTFVCQDREFLVHKAILAARSPVLQAMFKHKMKESEDGKTTITDFDSEIVELMLHFIYTDSVENLKDEEQAKKLLALADKYDLESLKLICMEKISKSVNNIAEAIEAIAIADQYHVAGFKEIAVEFIKNNHQNL